MAKNRGRQPIYTEEIAAHILDRLAHGDSLKSICDAARAQDKKFPAQPTVSEWAINDTPKGFGDKYTRARHIGILARLDRAHDDLATRTGKNYTDENGNVRVDSGAVQLARTYADLVKWEVSKLIPQYSDKQTIEHKGDIPLPSFQINLVDGNGKAVVKDAGDA